MIALLLSLAAAADPSALASDAGWRTLGDRASALGAITVRAKEIGGTPCFEGSVTAAAEGGDLVAVADRMREAPRWSRARLPVTEELQRQGRSFVLLQLLDVPAWTLASDRYWVLRGETSIDSAGVGVYRYQRLDAAAWPRAAEVVAARSPSAVEPPVSFGQWTFTPDAGGARVTWRSCADFGGVVPASLQAWVALQQLPDTMEDLVTEARRVGAR
jgi:hypothetical protein